MTGLAKKTSQFYDQIINANKTTNVSGLGAVTVGNPSFSHFTEVFGNNVNKRNIEVRDSLLNQKNFANYWKSREKHRDANIEPYKISYGIVTDQDGDGFAENVAFYTDSNGAQQILGYNEYVVTPPKMSDKKAKATYYQQTADERKKQSYPDFMYTRKELLTDWMKPDAIEKYIEKVDKSLVGIVKAFFAQSAKDVYSKLTPKQKTAFANAFIKIAADAMIDNEANKAQAAIVKGMKGFLTAKKTFIHQVMGDAYVSTYAAPTLVTQILSGNIGSVEDYLEALARGSGFYLSAYDVTKLFEYVTQTRYVRSQLTYNDDVNKAGYEEWISRQGGINPHSTEVHDFIGERTQFNQLLEGQQTNV